MQGLHGTVRGALFALGGLQREVCNWRSALRGSRFAVRGLCCEVGSEVGGARLAVHGWLGEVRCPSSMCEVLEWEVCGAKQCEVGGARLVVGGSQCEV